MFTDALIQQYIKEKKKIVEPLKAEMKLEHQHLRNDFKLTSIDGERHYSVFMRKHTKFQENFSIGLIFYSKESRSITLFRCNGNHGETIQDIKNPHPHFGYHTHTITSEDIENGIMEPKRVELIKDYASFEQAFRYFCNFVNIEHAIKYFPQFFKQNLF